MWWYGVTVESHQWLVFVIGLGLINPIIQVYFFNQNSIKIIILAHYLGSNNFFLQCLKQVIFKIIIGLDWWQANQFSPKHAP